MGILESLQISIQDWIAARSLALIGFQVMMVAGAVVLAWFIHRQTRSTLVRLLESGGLTDFRQHLLKIGQRLAFPVSVLTAVLLAKLIFYQLGLETPVLDVVFKLVLALAMIRLIVYALRIGIAPGPARRGVSARPP